MIRALEQNGEMLEAVYERIDFYPIAVEGILIDLDDDMGVNYDKFGKALAILK